MLSPHHDMETAFINLSAKEADIILLVLASQYIEAKSVQHDGRFDILVQKENLENALRIVDTYHKENRWFKRIKTVQQLNVSSFNSIAGMAIMVVLTIIHLLIFHFQIHENSVLKYGASALFIMQGETFRAVSALFLHADTRHLVGNLVGLVIFANPFIALSGYGTGPFMLLFCGTLGNLINAQLHHTAHLSIGASTAVMGAAGLLSAYQVIHNRRSGQWSNLFPIFAGALLMALLSQGERTDVGAHILGFFSGVVSGIIFFPLNRQIQSSYREPVALAITLVILLSALIQAQ